jgi:hypothetical protein
MAYPFFFFFLAVMWLGLGALHFLSSHLPLRPYHQPFSLWLFWRQVLVIAQASLDPNL